MYKVVEIFKSIDGEGVRTGLPVVFIRLHGCNLRCKYCDTKYSYNGNEYTDYEVYQIEMFEEEGNVYYRKVM